MNFNKLLILLKSFYHKIGFLVARKKLVIFISKRSCMVVDVQGNKIAQQHSFAANAYQDVQEVLSKYPQHLLYVIWAYNTNVTHESLPLVNNIAFSNPIREFIEEKFGSHDKAVSYRIHDIHGNKPEIWDVVFASASIEEQWYDVFLNAIKVKGAFGGVYLFPHILPSVFIELAKKQGVNIDIKAVNVFVIFSSVVGLRVIVTHGSNILFSKDVDYPNDASEEYIRGIIENEAADALIYLRNYLGKGDNEYKSFNLLLPESLAERCAKSDFGFDSQNIVYSYAKDAEGNNAHDVDQDLCKQFSRTPQDAAHHAGFSRLSAVRRVGVAITTPLLAFAMIMMILISFKWWQKTQLLEEIHLINSEYSANAALFRNMKEKFQDIRRLGQFTEFISISEAIEAKHEVSFVTLQNLYSLEALPGLELDFIRWTALDKDNHSEVDISVRYMIDGNDIQDGITSLRALIDDQNAQMPEGFYIVHTIDRYRSKAIGGRITIYADIQIKQRDV